VGGREPWKGEVLQRGTCVSKALKLLQEGGRIENSKEFFSVIGGLKTMGGSIGGRSAVGIGEEEEGKGRCRAADERGGGQPAWETGE
jgi:hypothetical protein